VQGVAKGCRTHNWVSLHSEVCPGQKLIGGEPLVSDSLPGTQMTQGRGTRVPALRQTQLQPFRTRASGCSNDYSTAGAAFLTTVGIASLALQSRSPMSPS